MEQNEIHTRLHAVEIMQGVHCERIEKLEVQMTGNGNPEAGVLMRLDRVEQSRLARKDRLVLFWGPLLSGVIVAAVTALATWAATWLGK